MNTATRGVSVARILGAFLILWVGCISKPFSTLQGSLLPWLVLFLLPLFIVHYFARKENYTNRSVNVWPFPLAPVLWIAGAMIFSSVANGKPVFHAMGPGLWVWAISLVVAARFWDEKFFAAICRAAFFVYLFWTFLHFFPLLQEPQSAAAVIFKQNYNLINANLGGLALIGFFHSSNRLRVPVFIAVSLLFLGFDTIGGLGALLITLLLFSKHRKLALVACIFITGAGLLYKLSISAENYGVRYYIVSQGLKQGMERPITGVGPGRTVVVEVSVGQRLSHPHCSIVNIFRLSGLIGLSGFLALLFGIYRYRERIPSAHMALLLFYLIWGTIDDFFVWYSTIMLIAIALSIRTEESALAKQIH